MLDRIDIFVEVPRIEFDKLSSLAPAESSASVRQRLDAATSLQTERFEDRPAQSNSDMLPADVREFCQSKADEQATEFLRLATNQLSLSARAFHRILKVARTIADLAGSDGLTSAHVAEAVQYRQRTRSV